jgi:hypothetical protein
MTTLIRTTETSAAVSPAIALESLDLRSLIERARNEPAAIVREIPGSDDFRVHRRSPTVSATIDLTASTLPDAKRSAADGSVRAALVPDMGTSVSKRISLSSAIASASAVIRAGATLLIQAPAVPVPSTGELPVIVLREQVAGLVNVSPLPLSKIADGTDAPAVTLASLLKRISAIFDGAPTFAASLTLTRREQMNADFDLNAALSYAIASGIAQTVDRVLLQSLAAIPFNGVPSIDFGRFAAANVDAQQLRALVGPQHDNSTGLVTFRPDGQLVAGGVPAELTSQGSKVIVGQWAGAGVGMGREITLNVTRAGKDGDVVLTALLELHPLVARKDWFQTIPVA